MNRSTHVVDRKRLHCVRCEGVRFIIKDTYLKDWQGCHKRDLDLKSEKSDLLHKMKMGKARMTAQYLDLVYHILI